MNRTIADAYDVETVYRAKRSQIIHLSDDCEAIRKASKILPSNAEAIPTWHYKVCEYCDPEKEAETRKQDEDDSWPV